MQYDKNLCQYSSYPHFTDTGKDSVVYVQVSRSKVWLHLYVLFYMDSLNKTGSLFLH